MKSWQRRFAPDILERGIEYYRQGEVEELEKTDYGYSAVVYGIDVYDVDIIADDGELTEMTCTCPYAQEGNNCKHMAAVLAAIEELSSREERDSLTYEETSNVISFEDEKIKMQERFLDECICSESAEELVANADFDEIEAFLISELESDERMLNRFKLFTTDIVTAGELEMYRSQIVDTFDSFKDEDGFVSYYMADELEDALYQFIETVICRLLLDNSKYEEAFLLTAVIIEEFDRLDIDDSGRIIVDVISTCKRVLEDIIERSNDFLERQIFQWIERRLEGGRPEGEGKDFIHESVMVLWRGNFNKPLYLTRKKAMILRKLQSYESKEEGSSNYYIREWISAYLDIAGRMEIPEEEIDAFERKYWELSDVRQYAADRRIAGGDIDRAIDILKESMKLDRYKSGLIMSYGRQLAALYKKSGDRDASREVLMDLVTEYTNGDLECFIKLKDDCTKKEWPAVRSVVLEKLPESHLKAELYREEKMYDKLMDYVMSMKDIFTIKRYERVLKPRYPQRLLVVYEYAVKEEAERAGDRRRYKEIAKILQRMKRYPDGEECVHRIVSEFRETYKRRKAMLEEISRL